MVPLKQNNGRLIDTARELGCIGKYDVLVVGGGMGGTGAAIAAARLGCKTILIERETSLGGLATIGLVNIPLDFSCGIGKEMLARLDKVNGHWHRNSDPEKHKLILDRMVSEAGVDLLLHTYAVDSIVSGNQIKGVVVENKSGRQAIMAERVIDCSGDADAAFFAGCECHIGRPSDGINQACSVDFRLGGVDWDIYLESDLKKNDSRWIKLIEKAVAEGDMPYMIENHLNWVTHLPGRPQHRKMDELSICFAHSRNCRPLDARDLTRMYLEGREQADTLWHFIKKRVPGFENCYLIDTATLLGVRESRRVVGEYIIQAKDIAQWKRFDDVITISGHGYDLHNPDGVGNIKWAEMEIDGKKCYAICHTGYGSSLFPPGGIDALTDGFGRKGADMKFPDLPNYDIPYRSLVPLKIDNLLVAGRCLSADFMAQSGCRLILACMNMGQTAGTAAALSLREQVTPRKLDRITLQKQIMHDGMEIGQKRRQIPGIDP